MSTTAAARTPLSVETLRLENTQRHEVRVRIEPWGDVYRMPPGDALEFVARGPAGDELDIEWADDAVTVFAWPGSVVYVKRGGRDVAPAPGDAPATRHPVPRLPDGMRLREWVAAMSAPLP